MPQRIKSMLRALPRRSPRRLRPVPSWSPSLRLRGHPSSYTATACTNAGMSNGCVTVPNYTSGSPLSGLTPGSSYFVQITAIGPTGYVNNNSAVSLSPTLATVQLAAPTNVTAAYGTAGAGSLAVNFTASGIVSPTQTYTVNICATNAMSGCVTPVNTNYTSGANITGLVYTPGSVGNTYYVDVIANASPGYLVSPASNQANHADVSQYGQPSQPVVAASARNGDITVDLTRHRDRLQLITPRWLLRPTR